MKNITLSIPEDLLEKGRAYARRHNKSLNQLIRDLLSGMVQNNSAISNLLEKSDLYAVDTENFKLNREEIYDREILR